MTPSNAHTTIETGVTRNRSHFGSSIPKIVNNKSAINHKVDVSQTELRTGDISTTKVTNVNFHVKRAINMYNSMTNLK